jgi:glycosyltransferase involved in cell wall biosynthesis
VDPVLFRPPEEKPEPGLLVTVKGLYPIGDPETLMRALGILKRRGIAFRHRHIGIGPLAPRMKALCEELGIADRVEFLGLVPHDGFRRSSAGRRSRCCRAGSSPARTWWARR